MMVISTCPVSQQWKLCKNRRCSSDCCQSQCGTMSKMRENNGIGKTYKIYEEHAAQVRPEEPCSPIQQALSSHAYSSMQKPWAGWGIGKLFMKAFDQMIVNVLFPYLKCFSDTPSAANSHLRFMLISVLPLISTSISACWEPLLADLHVHMQ